jgi:hypothetical protein
MAYLSDSDSASGYGPGGGPTLVLLEESDDVAVAGDDVVVVVAVLVAGDPVHRPGGPLPGGERDLLVLAGADHPPSAVAEWPERIAAV